MPVMPDTFQKFEEEVSDHQKDLDDARNLCKQLCEGIKESASKFDLKNKLTNIERPFNDLNKKIGEWLNLSCPQQSLFLQNH